MIQKQRFAHRVEYNEAGDQTFHDLLANTSAPKKKEKKIVKGQVIKIEKDIVTVDVGLKNEARIPLAEFKLTSNSGLPKEGDLVDVFVVKVEGRNGRTIVSREEAIRAEAWQCLLEFFGKNELVDGVIFSRVKGGFAVDLSGVVAFLPASQLDIRPIKDPTVLMNISCKFRILKMDAAQDNIVVSRRAVLEESRAEAKAETIAKINKGMVLKGIVKNITEYGAFIDLGHLDALLHITDIAYKRINHPSEVLKLGQELEVIVTKVDEANQRLHVGLKQLTESPWQNIEQEFKVGQTITGKVVALSDRNIFVELDNKEGVEGAVLYNEISWSKLETTPRRLFVIGQEVKCVITELDQEKEKLSLSIKRYSQNPWEKFANEYPKNSIITRTIRNITDFGIFVALDQNIDGMIHDTELSWEGRGKELLKNYKKGDEISCKVLEIDVEKERVSLGVKQLTEDPYESYYQQCNIGDIVEGTISEVTSNDSLKVTLNNGTTAIIRKFELQDSKAGQKGYQEGDKLTARIISIDRNMRIINLSIQVKNDEVAADSAEG